MTITMEIIGNFIMFLTILEPFNPVIRDRSITSIEPNHAFHTRNLKMQQSRKLPLITRKFLNQKKNITTLTI